MAHLDNGSREAKAFTIACARKRADGNNRVRFAGIMSAAFRNGILEPQKLAETFDLSVKTVRNWTEEGRGPNKKIETQVLKIIIAAAEPK